MHTRTTTLLAASLLTVALTACSSIDGTSDATPADSSTVETQPSSSAPGEDAALKAAVQAYTAAYFEGDADAAYSALSERCQGKVTPEMYKAIVEQAAKDYGPDHPATDVEAQVSGELARVSYKVEGLPKLDQKQQPWTLESGDWKYDAC